MKRIKCGKCGKRIAAGLVSLFSGLRYAKEA